MSSRDIISLSFELGDDAQFVTSGWFVNGLYSPAFICAKEYISTCLCQHAQTGPRLSCHSTILSISRSITKLNFFLIFRALGVTLSVDASEMSEPARKRPFAWVKRTHSAPTTLATTAASSGNRSGTGAAHGQYHVPWVPRVKYYCPPRRLKHACAAAEL